MEGSVTSTEKSFPQQLMPEPAEHASSSSSGKTSPDIVEQASRQDDVQETPAASSSGREQGVLDDIPPRNLASPFFNTTPASSRDGTNGVMVTAEEGELAIE
mmetsp:Transcript_98071/g.188158  ORF Transcript_98071/g.188158 Transcript_98071/m.188158 type:complete len:102 (+) Transcript_98071:48-353(+)